MVENIISVSNLSFKYQGNNHAAIDNISFKIKKGEFVVITGKSGCGKSTLSLCLAGFIPHSISGEIEGEVLVAGNDVSNLSPGKLAGIVGLVQQDPEAQLCTLNVLDEVAFGPENLCLPENEIRDRVLWALELVDAIDLLDRDVYSLSGGEKQRVAIASVLAMKPSLIILDEPTANLDPEGTVEVLKAVGKLREELDTTIIVIEHRLERVLPIADRLIKMEQGKIVLDQKLDQYMDNPMVKIKDSCLSDKRPQRYASCSEELLRIENLKACYGEKVVLEDVSFSLFPGDITAVMGNNGSGKTTLLLSLLGIVKIENGSIYYNGRGITEDKVSKRAREMGLVFQNPNHQIFETTVLKEATLPSTYLTQDVPDRIRTNAELLLKQFELIQYIDNLPFALSMGEKKRLTLVSVLAYNPPILLLDEPLVGQDNDRLELFTSELLERSKKGGITIMICHESSFVKKYCNRVLFLDHGKLIIDAPVDEALKRMEVLGYKEYLC